MFDNEIDQTSVPSVLGTAREKHSGILTSQTLCICIQSDSFSEHFYHSAG